MSILRIGGIASGFDTDKIVKDLMRVERLRVDRTFQQRQVLQWQKEQYRSLINKVRSFRDTYFDYTRPQANILSSATLKQLKASSSDPTIVAALPDADASVGSTEFRVIQSALAARAQSAPVTIGTGNGTRLAMTDSMEAVSAKLQNGPIAFDQESGTFTVKINDTGITVHKNDSLRSVLARINSSAAGVQAAYSSFSDTFTFTAKATGAGRITVDDGGNFFAALGLKESGKAEIGESGRDAVFTINGVQASRSSNTFSADNITYSIQKRVDQADQAPAVTVTVFPDTEAVYGTIEKFVSDYNKLIEDINSKLNEEHFRDFSPLTDEQKEKMSDKDIAKWEEKAQSGLLRRDPVLETMLRNMRTALYDMVGEIHLSAIGIEASSNYRDNGKLVLKNGGAVLRKVLSENPEKVNDFFTRRSDIPYSPNLSPEQRARRYRDSGLAQRLSDVLQDNLRIVRNSAGRKGELIERAGLEGDVSEFSNFYDKQISQVDKRIHQINEMLRKKEEQYYRQFTAMEKSLQQLYSQGDWLATQLQSLTR